VVARLRWPLAALLLGVAGCVSTGIVASDDGSYTLARKSAQLGIGPPADLEDEVYREARSFCKEKGKLMESVKMDLQDSSLVKAGSVTLQFRCI